MKKKHKHIFISIILVLSLFISNIVYADSTTNTNNITKTITPIPDSNGHYTVTIEITPEHSAPTQKDVVIVFESSLFMTNFGNDLDKAKAVVQSIVDALIDGDKANYTNIGLVSYSNTVKASIAPTNDISIIRTAINNLDSSGGSNIQMGLHAARLLLQNSNADYKQVILITDDLPNISYDIRSYESTEFNTSKNEFYYYYYLEDLFDDGKIYNLSGYGNRKLLVGKRFLPEEYMNYNCTVVNEEVGNSSTLAQTRRYIDENDTLKYNGRVVPEYQMEAEAHYLKQNGVDINLVGFVDAYEYDSEHVLRIMDGFNTYLKPSSSALVLSTKEQSEINDRMFDFNTSLFYNNINVNDTIDISKFDLVENSITLDGGEPNVSNYNVLNDGATINWSLGNINNTATLTYKLKLKDMPYQSITTPTSIDGNVVYRNGSTKNLPVTSLDIKNITYVDKDNNTHVFPYTSGSTVTVKSPNELDLNYANTKFNGWQQIQDNVLHENSATLTIDKDITLTGMWEDINNNIPQQNTSIVQNTGNTSNVGIDKWQKEYIEYKPNDESSKNDITKKVEQEDSTKTHNNQQKYITIQLVAQDGGTISSNNTIEVERGTTWANIIKHCVASPFKDYIFDGWYIDTQKLSLNHTFNEDTTIHAKFKKYNESKLLDYNTIATTNTIFGTLDYKNFYAYLQGYPDATIKAQRYVTREEVAAIFYRLLEPTFRKNIKSYINHFHDVHEGNWSNMHISTLYNANLITGYNDTTFKPYSNITRAEFITILSKFNTLETKFNLHNFTDIDNHWAYDYIQNAYTKGWVCGYHDNTFRPNDYITRAELSYILNTALDRSIHKDSYKLRDIKTFKDLDELSWFYDSIIIATNSYTSTEKRNDKQIWNSVFKTPFEM